MRPPDRDEQQRRQQITRLRTDNEDERSLQSYGFSAEKLPGRPDGMHFAKVELARVMIIIAPGQSAQ